MKFSGIMIVTDLDGTFYNERTEYVPRNLEAVEYFKKNGGLFTVASGRVPSSLHDRMDDFTSLTNAPAILCNGGFCYDFKRRERMLQIELDTKKAVEIISIVRKEFPDVSIRCSLSDGEVRLSGSSIDFDSFTGWTRVSFDGDENTLDSMRLRLEDSYKEYFSFMKACPTIYEFQSSTATKGQALDRLRTHLCRIGLTEKEPKIYAVGDFENDLDLLAHCDVPACPANAIDAVKNVAVVHLCHCNDGAIADLISRIEKGEA